MRAMILKDLLCMKKQAKSVLLVLLVWLVISLTTASGAFFCGLSIIYVIILPMASLSYDERSHWDSRALTMPVTRAQLVLGRYIVALLMGLAMLAISAVVTLLIDGAEGLPLCLVFFLAGVFLLSLCMPLMLKLGVEKARILVALCYLVPFGLMLLAEQLVVDIYGLLSRLDSAYAAAAGAVLVFAALCVSVLISMGIYRKKEF